METVTRLFRLYAENLTLYHPQYQNIFICPLCLRPFDSSAIREKRISKEHIIPESLGGRLITLTCTPCNNQHGTKLDAHLVQRLRIEDILQGKSETPVRAKVKIGEGEQTADIYLSGDNPNIRIIGIPELSNPVLHDNILRELERGGPVEIQMQANLGYNKTRSSVAVLRAGYLLMFRHFGYGYILHENASLVRKQFLEPGSSSEILHGLLWLDESAPSNRIGLLQEPENLRCFIAVLELSTEIERSVGVVLPGIGPEESNIYQRWANVDEAKISRTQPRIIFYEYNRKTLIDPEFKHLPYLIWKMHRNQ